MTYIPCKTIEQSGAVVTLTFRSEGEALNFFRSTICGLMPKAPELSIEEKMASFHRSRGCCNGGDIAACTRDRAHAAAQPVKHPREPGEFDGTESEPTNRADWLALHGKDFP